MSLDNDTARLDTIRENKLSLVERLADDLAHEIKNPLHSMVINLEVLRRRLARLDGSADELLHFVGILTSELDRVNRRVDLLLRVTRPNPIPGDITTLDEIVDELRELLEIECHRHGVSLALELQDVCLAARLPRSPTRQVLLTLSLNVLDSLPRGAVLCLRCEPDGHRLRFETLAMDSGGNPAAIEMHEPRGASLDALVAIAAPLSGCIDVVELDGPRTNGSRGALTGYRLTLPLQP